MLGEKDVSILGRLKDRIGDTFSGFVNYMTEKMAYVEPRINQRTKCTSNKEDTKDEMYK